MTDGVPVLNGGSSTIKFALYGAEQLDVMCCGGIEGIGRQGTVHLGRNRRRCGGGLAGVLSRNAAGMTILDHFAGHPRPNRPQGD